jgi:hypothetical protein
MSLRFSAVASASSRCQTWAGSPCHAISFLFLNSFRSNAWLRCRTFLSRTAAHFLAFARGTAAAFRFRLLTLFARHRFSVSVR